VKGRWNHLLALSVAIGIFSVVSLPASSALLVREGNLYGMGLAMGIFNGAMNSGTVLAPLAGGFALGFFGIKTIFYGAAFLGLIGIVFFCFCTWPVANPRQRRSDQDLDFRNDTLFQPDLYAEVVRDQKVSPWLACRRRAFEFFNGVPVIAGVIWSNKKMKGYEND